MPPTVASFQALIEIYAPAVPDFFFIQVGANDGRSGDPLHRHIAERNWSGIVIEPQQWVYEHQLSPRYRDFDRLALENVAIADTEGYRDLYKISFSNRRWATGLASLRREQFVGPRIRAYIDRCVGDERAKLPRRQEDCVTSERVRTMTFDSLLDKYRPEKVDLLQIDAEGYDCELLHIYRFERVAPTIIQYEHHGASTRDQEAALSLLQNKGYLTFPDGINTVAILRNAASELDATLPC